MELDTIKTNLILFPKEESEIKDRKIEDLESSFIPSFKEIKSRLKSFSDEFIFAISNQLEEIEILFKKVVNSITFYEDLCDKARSRLIIALDGLVDEKTVVSETTNYPGKNILYKSIFKLKNPDYIFALMQQKVLKNRELCRAISFEIKNNPDKTFSYEELLIKDKGIAIQAQHRALLTVTEAIFGKPTYDFYNDELCFFQGEGSENRAVFVAIGEQVRRSPSVTKIKQKFGKLATINPRSEAAITSETEVTIHAGSILGDPAPIKVRVPYFIRSYSITQG